MFTNVRNRHRVMAAGAILAVATIAAGYFAVNAQADPASLAVDTNNGRKTLRHFHDNGVWYVDLAVDTHRGFQDETNDTYLSGEGDIARGPGVVRVQDDAIRTTLAGATITDFFPSKNKFVRDNTPGGLPGPCTSIAGSSLNLYDDVSQQIGCQKGPDRLNSDADYAGNVILVKGYSDWLPTGTALTSLSCSTTMATRGFFAIRWADNSYEQVSLRTASVPANPNC